MVAVLLSLALAVACVARGMLLVLAGWLGGCHPGGILESLEQLLQSEKGAAQTSCWCCGGNAVQWVWSGCCLAFFTCAAAT
jgi:hypothetical protein